MTDRMKADLRMYPNLVGYIDITPIPSSSRPGLITGNNLLRTQVIRIGQASGLQGVITTGSTQDRRIAYNELCTEIFEVGSGVRAYAGNAKDYTLFNKFMTNEDDIHRIGFDLIGDYTDTFTLLVNPLVPVLHTDWGVDTTKMTLLGTKLSNYRTEETLPRHAVTGRKTQTDLLPDMFTEARRIIKEIILPAGITLRSGNTAWFQDFKNSMTVVDYPTGTTVFEGYLLDANGHAIFNGNVHFAEQNITVTSLFDGSYHKAHFPHGVTTPTASAATFISQTAPAIEVIQGHIVHHNFTLIHL